MLLSNRKGVRDLQTIVRTYFNFYEPMRPVSRVRIMNPTAIIQDTKEQEEKKSYFYNEPIVTEKTALEEVLYRRLREEHKIELTPEQKAERRIINRYLKKII